MPYKNKNNNGFGKADQRYLPRWEVSNRVFFQLDEEDNVFNGETKDLSCAGACFASERDLSIDQDVQLTIFLSDEISVHVKGRVVWVKQAGDEKINGVHFSNLTSKSQETILDYAFELDKMKVANHWFEGWKK